jgi:hypothetical protein
MYHVECLKLSSILANIAIAIFRVNTYWLDIFEVSNKWYMTSLGGMGEQAAL